MNKASLIDFDKLGDSSVGYISVAQSDKMPFRTERVCWTYGTPETITRGRHGHYKTEQVLIALSGRIVVTTESADGEIKTFKLDTPEKGVYIPPDVWHTMQYSNGAIQLLLASAPYDENDYIRDYDKFMQVWKNK